MDLFLSTRQAARFVRTHESSVKRWCNSGELSCSLTEGGHRRIPLRGLLDFAQVRGLDSPLPGFAPEEEEVCQAILSAEARQDYSGLAGLVYGWLIDGERHRPIRLLETCREMGFGPAELFDHVVAPVMHRVGEDWYAGTLQVGDEHRVTQVVVDALHRLRRADLPGAGPVAVLGCEEGNAHELGALMVRQLLEAHGWDVVYLGPHVPVEDLVSQQSARAARLVCVSISRPAAPSDGGRLVRSLARQYRPEQPYRLALGGSALRGLDGLAAGPLPFVDCQVFTDVTSFAGWLQGIQPGS